MWNGNEVSDLRTPLFSDKVGGKLVHKSYTAILEEFDDIFDTVMNQLGKVDDYLRGLIEDMESGQRKKVGSKSLHFGWPKDGPDKVEALYSTKKPGDGFSRAAWDLALVETAKLVPSNSVNFISKEEAINGIPTGSNVQGQIDMVGMDTTTNSGLPGVTSPYKPSEDQKPAQREQSALVYENIMSEVERLEPLLRRGEVPHWVALVGQRLTSAGIKWKESDKKKRLIIAIQKAETILWKKITVGIYAALREYKHNGVPPFVAVIDLPAIDYYIQVALREAEDNGEILLGGDYAGFDQTINPELLGTLGPIIDKWLINGGKYASSLVTAMTKNVTLVTPNKIYPEKDMGMPSGSGGTNLGDSLYNYNALKYGEVRGYYKIRHIAVQGDDFIISGPGVTAESVERATSEVGLVAHKEKQFYKRGATNFLQRLHVLGRVGGIASVYRTLGSSLVYERMLFKSGDWNAFVDIVRTLSQLENAAFSPAFEELCRFVRDNDKYKLGAKYPSSTVMKMAGSTGKVVVEKDNIGAWKSGHGAEGFEKLAVNGVIRERELPPHGSIARFLAVYGERVNNLKLDTNVLQELGIK
jgi:hypothetical protein